MRPWVSLPLVCFLTLLTGGLARGPPFTTLSPPAEAGCASLPWRGPCSGAGPPAPAACGLAEGTSAVRTPWGAGGALEREAGCDACCSSGFSISQRIFDLKKNQLFGIEVVAAAQVLRLPSLLQDPRDRAWVPASSVSVAPSSPRWGRQREQQWERRDQEAVQSPTLRHKGVRCELVRGFSCFLFPSLKNTLNETRTQIHTASVPLPTYQLPTCLAISLSICLCILQLGKPRPNTS